MPTPDFEAGRVMVQSAAEAIQNNPGKTCLGVFGIFTAWKSWGRYQRQCQRRCVYRKARRAFGAFMAHEVDHDCTNADRRKRIDEIRRDFGIGVDSRE